MAAVAGERRRSTAGDGRVTAAKRARPLAVVRAALRNDIVPVRLDGDDETRCDFVCAMRATLSARGVGAARVRVGLNG